MVTLGLTHIASSRRQQAVEPRTIEHVRRAEFDSLQGTRERLLEPQLAAHLYARAAEHLLGQDSVLRCDAYALEHHEPWEHAAKGLEHGPGRTEVTRRLKTKV